MGLRAEKWKVKEWRAGFTRVDTTEAVEMGKKRAGGSGGGGDTAAWCWGCKRHMSKSSDRVWGCLGALRTVGCPLFG